MPTGNGRYVSEYYKVQKECQFRVSEIGKTSNDIRYLDFNGKSLAVNIK